MTFQQMFLGKQKPAAKAADKAKEKKQNKKQLKAGRKWKGKTERWLYE